MQFDQHKILSGFMLVSLKNILKKNILNSQKITISVASYFIVMINPITVMGYHLRLSSID